MVLRGRVEHAVFGPYPDLPVQNQLSKPTNRRKTLRDGSKKASVMLANNRRVSLWVDQDLGG